MSHKDSPLNQLIGGTLMGIGLALSDGDTIQGQSV